jgi:heptosyltransferase-2/heptosyltransferase-3
VVLRYGAIGDVIRLTVLLRILADRWQRPCDVIGDHPATPDVLRGLNSVGEVVVFGVRRVPLAVSPQKRSLLRWLRRRRDSPVYLIEERRHRALPWRHATTAELLVARAGFAADEVVTLERCPRGHLEHALDHLRRLGQLDPPGRRSPGGDRPADDAPPELAVGEDEIAEAREWLRGWGWSRRPLIVLQTQARRSHRGAWPEERWRELIGELLRRRPEATLLLAGSAAERRAVGRLVAAETDPRVRVAAGDLPLRRLFAVLTLAHSSISLDTGPAHAAAALGCPLVVLAGRGDPRRHRPCGPAERVQVVHAFADDVLPANPAEWFVRHDMAAIEVAAVLAAWERLTHRT